MREGQIIFSLGEIRADPQRLVVMYNRRVIFARMAKQVSQFLMSKKQIRIDLETMLVSATRLAFSAKAAQSAAAGSSRTDCARRPGPAID